MSMALKRWPPLRLAGVHEVGPLKIWDNVKILLTPPVPGIDTLL